MRWHEDIMDLRYDGLGLFYYGFSIDFALVRLGDNGLYPFGMSMTGS